MFRILRAIWNKIMGMFGGVSEGIEEDPDVIAATYDASISKSRDRLTTVKQAVAKLMGIEDTKKSQLNALTTTIEKLNKVKAGSAARATSIVAAMKAQGASDEQIKGNPDIIRAQAAFNDASADLAKKLAESKTKETELHSLQGNLARMKADLQSMMRHAESLGAEKQETIADVVSAKEQAAVNALLSGVSREGTDQALERSREARRNVTNRAKLASELAGLEAGAQGNEYAEYADSGAADNEFAALIGLESKSKEKLSPAQLPDS
jgi:phosphate uptake regulator